MVLISLIGCSENENILIRNKEEEFIAIGSSTGLFYYKNELYTGIYEDYHESGQLIKKGSFLNGRRNCIWEWYYDNGKLMRKGSYLNGENGWCLGNLSR